MAAFSTLLKSFVRNANLVKNGAAVSNNLLRPNTSNALEAVRKMSGHEMMHIKPSRWSWNRFKDLLNFYVMLGVIPATVVITYINLFIGPAKLAEIPEGYVPEVHEYYAHPITRWMTKHVKKSYQQEYEVMCQHIYETDYARKLRLAEKRVHQKMQEKQDSQAYYYEPVTGRNERHFKSMLDRAPENVGTR
ncbi:NADH dehydrogenase [ubiquinone] 1 beta subcomplex subunit 5, mitochondrial-like isoform X1 [Daphnia pulex]|uniref:NADH dehydrogenase [ubiquinone] 1 beta subcomplex subunit 5, mitochondrial n=1 Tax=Daphnia pulex TaxID=6669 RepID=A0A4Y7MV77_DAPPU|nr:NADH dehydrogenase [ubiquinone] 1 beta subcomplex subunit 5, mitochondrial-like isoform X1 [Daphnia pulex]SVE84564.1 EOG090X0FIE [Daphnia pulex]